MPADAKQTVAALAALSARITASLPKAAGAAGLVFQAAGMRRTRVKRGTLRRSWKMEMVGPMARVGPSVVYARRIELGFEGPDKLGRVYHQKPKPYVRPAFLESRNTAISAAAKVLAVAVRG